MFLKPCSWYTEVFAKVLSFRGWTRVVHRKNFLSSPSPPALLEQRGKLICPILLVACENRQDFRKFLTEISKILFNFFACSLVSHLTYESNINKIEVRSATSQGSSCYLNSKMQEEMLLLLDRGCVVAVQGALPPKLHSLVAELQSSYDRHRAKAWSSWPESP